MKGTNMQRVKDFLTLPKVCYILIALMIIYSQVAYYGILGRPWLWLVEAPPDAGFFWMFSYDLFWYFELPAIWLVLYISLMCSTMMAGIVALGRVWNIWLLGCRINTNAVK